MDSVTKFEHKGIVVAFNGKDKISLTDLWKAANGRPFQAPKLWLQMEETKKFITAVARSQKVATDYLLTIQRGRTGGTWAHWQIWLAYAKYLSPELHIWANQVVKERIEEERNPDLAFDRGQQRAINGYLKQGKSREWISRRLQAKAAFVADNSVLLKRGDNGMVFPLCADAINKEILGKGARQWKRENNLPDRAKTRDNLDEIQLLQIALATAVSSRDIEKMDIRGNMACAIVHTNVAQKIAQAVSERDAV